MKFSCIFSSFAACVASGDSEALNLLQTTAINKHGHGGPSVTCPVGYKWAPGIGHKAWKNCPGTTLKGWCVLPTANAYALCDKDPKCTGVSHTSNHGWLGSYGSDSVQPFRGTLKGNKEWTSCVKDVGHFSCPEGYEKKKGIGAQVWKDCPGTIAGGWCIKPKASAYDLCDSDPSCGGVSHTIDQAWLGTFGAGSVQPFKGAALDPNYQQPWSSCVKRADFEKLNPRISCPAGYEAHQGVFSARWANCPGSTVGGWCVLPKAAGYALCDSEPSCTMVSHTSNARWLGDKGQNSVQLGKGTINSGNKEWASCVKLTTTTTTTTIKMFVACPDEGKENTNECPSGCTYVDNCAQCEMAAKKWGKPYSTEPAAPGSPRPRGCFRNRKFLIKCNTANPEGPYRGKFPICQKIV